MPTAGHDERPRLHGPNGIHGSNSKPPIFTITETQEKVKQQGITLTSFISVIRVGSPPNKPWGCEASDPCQQEAAEEKESTIVAESQHDARHSPKVRASGLRATLDLDSDDHRSAGGTPFYPFIVCIFGFPISAFPLLIYIWFHSIPVYFLYCDLFFFLAFVCTLF
eukprot:TRINITY_DN144261_c1_g1_i5.p1 TRINITY_DN144261_c1_g1~~TRINITY_DN144261_c1_g1_i5.p1  ORF type:complete len:189 (+),score=27.67 TRINITY_DN144261_c1_g1_i5:70-567(+)